MGDGNLNTLGKDTPLKQSPVPISIAILRLKSQGVSLSRIRLYQCIYEKKLSLIQSETFAGSGRARPGGRILVDWNEVEKMFVLGISAPGER